MQLHAAAFICLLHQYINFHFNLLFIWLRYISVLISNINEKYNNTLGVGHIFGCVHPIAPITSSLSAWKLQDAHPRKSNDLALEL